MEIQTHYLTQNDCYLAGRTMTPAGIVVHDTAVNQRRVAPYLSSWNKPGVEKCVHAFIGIRPDGSFGVVQTLPWDRRCWGCGKGAKGSYNSSHIQFEICQDDRTDPEWFARCYAEAAALCAHLCKVYGLPVSRIVDHAEAHRQGYASNHGDTADWFPRFGKSMDAFRAEVQAAMTASAAERPADENGGGCEVTLAVLKSGSRGEAVKALQLLLIGRGCSCGSCGADGIFGGGTLAAVKAYQSARNLDVDGIVGPKTWARLIGAA